MQHTLFVDSDVVISSLLSTSGAAFLLINNTNGVKLFISNLSQEELEIVVSRSRLSIDALRLLITDKLDIIQLKQSAKQAREAYREYVKDINDAHIVLGAKQAKARFLITYNLKDFRTENIKQDFDILVMTPGQFMQYLRSIQ